MRGSWDMLRDRGGNFAMLGAILSIPLVMGAGLAVDLATIARYKSELQQAIDAAALAVAREGKDISDEKAQGIADLFLGNNLHPEHTKLVVVRDGTTVSVRAETRAPMAFGGLFGYDQYPIVAAASTDTAYATYEIALVLDTTGSMRGGKLTAMKDAVVGMIDSMSDQINDKDKLKFAIVPFSTFVNVGAHHGPSFDKTGKQVPGTGAKWLDLNGVSTVKQIELGTGVSRFQLYRNLDREWSGCVETRVPGSRDYDVSTEPADPSRPDSLYIPAFAIDEPDSGGYANSYIKSDADPFDASVATRRQTWAKYGVETNASGFPLFGGFLSALFSILFDGGISSSAGVEQQKGPGFGCVAQPITPLSNNYKALKDSVNALQAQGTTNIGEGVAWGARVLSPGEPFPGAQERGKPGVEKIMVVLTDGANVFGNNRTAFRSSYTSRGYLVDGRLGVTSANASQTNALMNERTVAACDHAKANGMTVYTIRLEEPDVKTGTMLLDCATSPGHYFDAPSRNQLDDVFQTIRDRVVRVRIAS